MTDTGGDPACWAERVCPACGMLDERAAGDRTDTCPHCGDRQEDHPPTLDGAGEDGAAERAGPTDPAGPAGAAGPTDAAGPTVTAGPADTRNGR